LKYAVLVPDGACDYPIDKLEGKTPFEVAKIPNMNFIAQNGLVGITTTIPKGFAPASDVANLSILGYDPAVYYSGRGPLEAANMGIEIKEGDVAFRCNLVTIDNDTMIDYSAGHITSKEAAEIINIVNEKLGSANVSFYPGVGYRHLMVVRDKSLAKELLKTRCIPPHDITGYKVSKNLPKGPAAKFIIDLMEKAKAPLGEAEVNRVRIDLKENPANAIWLWGQGAAVNMPKFKDRFGVEGSIISAVDLIKGIGKLIGLEPLSVPGATGYYDTNYKGKGEYAINSLEHKDFCFVHIEATDEAGHNGDLRAKIAGLENFDKFIVGPILKTLKAKGQPFRIMVLADHYTPVKVKTHTQDPVFFGIYGEGIQANGIEAFNEISSAKSKFSIPKAYDLMDYFIKGKLKV
jgi:2,3-bisphosphoglycerate-independent phosphoglycerate mutase